MNNHSQDKFFYLCFNLTTVFFARIHVSWCTTINYPSWLFKISGRKKISILKFMFNITYKYCLYSKRNLLFLLMFEWGEVEMSSLMFLSLLWCPWYDFSFNFSYHMRLIWILVMVNHFGKDSFIRSFIMSSGFFCFKLQISNSIDKSSMTLQGNSTSDWIY